MERWATIRQIAQSARTAADVGDIPLRASDAVSACVKNLDLTIVPVPTDDPLLGGARSVLYADSGIIAVDADLPEEARWFAVAHELGHRHLHGGGFRCAPGDVEEAPVTTPLPIGEGRVETYNPRQRREAEANVFAAEFLMPRSLLRKRFLQGDRLEALTSLLGVSDTALLSQLAASLLTPRTTKLPGAPAPSALVLDGTQRDAARTPTGPLLVDAGPGTGKTRTLSGRVLFLIDELAVPPEQILVLTFSNKAAQELRERLAAVVPTQAHALTIGTFHSFCLDLLRRLAPQAGIPADVRILDLVDAALMLERRLSELELVEYANLSNPGLYLKDILRAIARAKDELRGPEDYDALADAMAKTAQSDEEHTTATRAAEVARVYRSYDRMLAEQGLVDFGDLLVKSVAALEQHEEVRHHLQETYRHILVDEYQDVNRASAVLLRLLAGNGVGLWAVGDLRQSIYRFRGASPANIGRFEEDFPGGRRTGLEVNYRSVESLVTLFGYAAQKIPLVGPPPPRWHSERGEGNTRPSIYRAEASDAEAEADGVAALIESHRRSGYSYADQAVLCRTNGQAADIAMALETRAIPVAYIGDLFERTEVKDVLAVFMLVAETDGAGLVRVAGLEDHPLAQDDVIAILTSARELGHPFPMALLHASAYSGVTIDGAATATALGRCLRDISYGRDAWQFLARYMFADGTYVARLLAATTVRAQQGLLALGQLLLLARAFANRPVSDNAESKVAFLRYVRHLIATQDTRLQLPAEIDDLDAVRVLTVHASKGLEFPVVFVPNLGQQRFPPAKQWDPAPPPQGLLPIDPADSEQVEEACLFFVALSRARNVLVLSRAEKYGKFRRQPSPLWALVEDHLRDGGIAVDRWQGPSQVPMPRLPLQVPMGEPSVDEKIELSLSQVERYLVCPRQSYYRDVLRLRDHEEELGYKRFHDCVRETAAWLRDPRRDRNLPTTWEDVIAVLSTTWAVDGPVGHVHENQYRESAEEMLRPLWEELESTPPAAPWHAELPVELDQCRIIVRFDHSEVDEKGVRLVRYRTGRAKDDHRKEPRLALYREAGRQHAGGGPVTIELAYLSDGTRVPVQDQGRYERDRLSKLNEAALRIARGEFPADPAESGTCARCPYNLICPA